MAWQNPKTDWKAGDVPASSDFNRIEGNINELQDAIDDHAASTDNPHNVTKSQVGLGNVDNMSASAIRTDSTKPLRAEVSSSAPSSPANGQIYYNSTDHKFKGYANGAWV